MTRDYHEDSVFVSLMSPVAGGSSYGTENMSKIVGTENYSKLVLLTASYLNNFLFKQMRDNRW